MPGQSGYARDGSCELTTKLTCRGLNDARSSGLVRSKAECSSEEADLAVRTLLDILLQSRVCQASQVRLNKSMLL